MKYVMVGTAKKIWRRKYYMWVPEFSKWGVMAKRGDDRLPIFTEVQVTLPFFVKKWVKNAIKSVFWCFGGSNLKIFLFS